MIRHRDFFVTCTIGIAMFPDHGNSRTSCCARGRGAARRQDLGRQRASSTASTCARVDAAPRARNRTAPRARDRRIVPGLPAADRAGSGRIASVEALVRWRHPTRGIVPPDELISVAENPDSSFRVGPVMRDVLRARSSARRGGRQTCASRSSCGRGVRSGAGTPAPGIRAPRRGGAAPAPLLETEITESLLMAGDEAARRRCARRANSASTWRSTYFGTGVLVAGDLKHFPIESSRSIVVVADWPRFNDAAMAR